LYHTDSHGAVFPLFPSFVCRFSFIIDSVEARSHHTVFTVPSCYLPLSHPIHRCPTLLFFVTTFTSFCPSNPVNFFLPSLLTHSITSTVSSETPLFSSCVSHRTDSARAFSPISPSLVRQFRGHLDSIQQHRHPTL
jgi:hypothetical protein